MTFAELISLVGGGVTLHNVLGYVSARLTGVATAVATADVATLRHDASGALDYVETHDPAVAKAVAEKADQLRADAQAEVDRVRADAAAELRKLAAAVEHAASAVPAVPVAVAPVAPGA